jgi:hypothetical protein
MRFLLMMLATATSGLGCERDPALSNTTNHLAPAPATAITAPGSKNVRTSIPESAVISAASTRIAPNQNAPSPNALTAAAVTSDTIAPGAIIGVAVARDAVTAGGVAPSRAISGEMPAPSANGAQPKPTSGFSSGATDPSAPSDGDGEPMDDVDDEVVPATDKSGVDNVETEDGPPGPVDEDSEGADIDLRE